MFTISKLKYKNMLGVSLQLQFTSNLTLPLTITSYKQMFFLHFCPPNNILACSSTQEQYYRIKQTTLNNKNIPKKELFTKELQFSGALTRAPQVRCYIMDQEPYYISTG